MRRKRMSVISDFRNQKAPFPHPLVYIIDFSENVQTCYRVHDITPVIDETMGVYDWQTRSNMPVLWSGQFLADRLLIMLRERPGWYKRYHWGYHPTSATSSKYLFAFPIALSFVIRSHSDDQTEWPLQYISGWNQWNIEDVSWFA